MAAAVSDRNSVRTALELQLSRGRSLEALRIVASVPIHTSVERIRLIDMLLSLLARVPLVMPIPNGVVFQSVAESEVAEHLVACLGTGPRGRATDFGGPEILTLRDMARTWMEIRGVRKTTIPVPIPGRVAEGFRAGKHTTERVRTDFRTGSSMSRLIHMGKICDAIAYFATSSNSCGR